MRGYFGAVVLIVIGALLLARNLGYLNVSLIRVVGTWWPLLLIGLGISFFFTPGGRK